MKLEKIKKVGVELYLQSRLSPNFLSSLCLLVSLILDPLDIELGIRGPLLK
jgi:hypothetical protein